MLKLLIITPYVLYPINSGGNKIIFELLDRLRKDIDITLLFSLSENEVINAENLQKLWPNVHIYVHRKDKKYKEKNENIEVKSLRYFNILDKIHHSTGRKLKRLRIKMSNKDGLIREHSGMYNKFYEPFDESYINFLHQIIDSNHFDLIEVNFIELLNIVNALPPNIKTIYVQHEIKYIVEEQRYNLLENPKPMDMFLLNYIRNFELQNLNAYNNIITLTDIDNKKMKEALPKSKNIYTSEAVVSTDNLHIYSAFEFNNRLVFLGLGDHFPNHQGLDWFLNNCWEYIQNNNRNLILDIIGRWHNKLVDYYSLKYKNIRFRGFVEDLNNELQNVIMIVPIHIGSGLRIKIMDAVIAGCPMVTTTIGVEGNDLEDKKDCLIADNPIDFAESILKLAKDNELCNTLRNNAITKFASRPTPEALARKRLDIYRRIVENT